MSRYGKFRRLAGSNVLRGRFSKHNLPRYVTSRFVCLRACSHLLGLFFSFRGNRTALDLTGPFGKRVFGLAFVSLSLLSIACAKRGSWWTGRLIGCYGFLHPLALSFSLTHSWYCKQRFSDFPRARFFRFKCCQSSIVLPTNRMSLASAVPEGVSTNLLTETNAKHLPSTYTARYHFRLFRRASTGQQLHDCIYLLLASFDKVLLTATVDKLWFILLLSLEFIQTIAARLA